MSDQHFGKVVQLSTRRVGTMADHLKNSALPRVLSDVMGDLGDLVRKEIELAKSEVSNKLSTKFYAGKWMAIAGALGLVAVLVLVQASIFGVAAASGLALHWSCLTVAVVLAAIAGAAYLKGQADAEKEVTPNRTIHQVKEDIATVKEQFS